MQATLPISLITSLTDAPGFDADAFTQVHASGQQVTSIRINPLKCTSDEISFNKTPIPWTSNGFYLEERPSFTLDPLLHAGCYYVQEASSMFVEQALKQTIDLHKNLKVLDLCAAPGGKSTLIQSLITNGSLLVSNDVIKSRSAILQENITKWGGTNVVVTSNDPKDFARLENFFDVIVIDAPCSGSGLFRRDPAAIEEWSEANVELCSQRQQRIVADALPALKKDGILIYCTCSYSVKEDEAVVDWLCENFGMSRCNQLQIAQDWNIVTSFTGKHHVPCYRFYPDKVKGEGFFLSCLQKSNGEHEASYRLKQKNEKLSKADLLAVQHWIDPNANLHLFRHKDDVIAVSQGLEQFIPVLQERLYLRQAGINIGKVAHNELIPDHALAMSRIINNSITTITLNLSDALQYLRKAEVIPGASSKGWALVQYNGHKLGWVKILHNRLNNYYPKEWRILKS